ncbi:MAG: gamma-glutamylcyclotransferase [Rhodanobacteraceae bacterium]
MSHDTTIINQERQDLSHHESIWLFGYGSLIYKAGFDFLERRPAWIHGWQRRFWQGSHDHRGTPDAPGRVLTLVADEESDCFGMAYRIRPDAIPALDVREKNGYLRFEADMRFADDSDAKGLVYIAKPDNAAWLGPASDEHIARHIANSEGPSGPNREYLLKLAQSLRDHGEQDAHVFAVERALLAIRADS